MTYTLFSDIDASVNVVLDADDGGKFECRFVRRCDEYFIVYLSSHSGCNKACRMCHLTATGQTMFGEASPEAFIRQAGVVMAHYDDQVIHGAKKASRVNFNWMARGEPLSNKQLKMNWPFIRDRLALLARWRGLEPHYHISTIVPESDVGDWSWLRGDNITVYYSIYSTDRTFRRRWLPRAAEPHMALSSLEWWQSMTGGDVVLHGPFIDHENDDYDTVARIINAVEVSGLRVKRFNHVAYNPPNDKSREADPATIAARLAQYEAAGIPARQIPRVGFDVKASCGMFVNN